eukprot:CAMPEP_0117690114 /NCGR_PEP_ID=MMETSP0804-20121206/24931_1 /TAXON_ID=1074897 /ORGANISM="Tetraselmis astigmatica, Strain CCMP880" /LENGTH=348 /DNA_ID=CAMNT_0005503093 /DNA_START=330 /DNA_END=1373 /DNA_ORIENTATION=-
MSPFLRGHSGAPAVAAALLLCFHWSTAAARDMKSIQYLKDDRFPGWKGEVATVDAMMKQAHQMEQQMRDAAHKEGELEASEPELHTGSRIPYSYISHHRMTYGGDSGEVTYSGDVYLLSESPRIYLYKNLLSQTECEYLMDHSRTGLKASTVVDNKTGKGVPSQVRTSYGTHFGKHQNEIISTIEARVAEVLMIPEENQEPMQILRYEHGQKYDPHQDYFHDEYNQREEMGGQRVATVLMYLATVEDGAGGETVFPKVRVPNDTRDPKVWSDCARKGFAVKATAGDAVVFYSIKPDGSLDPNSLHGSCPTYAGEKWSATKWIRAQSFGRKEKKKRTGCYDEEIMCETW